MQILQNFCERRNSNGTNVLKPNSFLKEIRIQDTSTVLPMADTERNVLNLWFRMKGRLKAMSILSRILPIIISVCSENRRKGTSLWMNPEQMISPRFQLGKITCLRHLILRKK